MNAPFASPSAAEASPGSLARRLDMPVGYLHRVAAQDDEVDETRRNLLKLAAVAGILGIGVGGAVGGALQFVRPPVVGLSSYPRTQLFDVDGTPLTLAKVEGTSPDYQGEYNVETGDLYLFNYPLLDEPNFLLNLYPANGQPPSTTPPVNPGATNVPYGIGDHGSIVAFSAICQHLGCPSPALAYYPPGTCPRSFNGRPFYLHCSCHGSTYDAANAAAVLTGPTALPLPQVVLESDAAGNIYATGMTPASPPVNGHVSTLQGDYGVGSSSQLAEESAVIACNFPS